MLIHGLNFFLTEKVLLHTGTNGLAFGLRHEELDTLKISIENIL